MVGKSFMWGYLVNPAHTPWHIVSLHIASSMDFATVLHQLFMVLSDVLVLTLKTKMYAEHCHMGISLIPKYNQFASNTICRKVLGNINCHYKIQVNLQHCVLETMVNIDKYNEPSSPWVTICS